MAQPKPAGRNDPTTVDSRHYTVIAEDDRVRVLKVSYGPHEKSVMHSHPALVAVFLTDGHVKLTYPDGASEERHGTAGQAMVMGAETHLPENIGDQPMQIILVELKS